MPKRAVFWEVDAQEDFMLPGGKLYVPGAEKLIPNIKRLVEAAVASRTLLVSSACAHAENDPEFRTFPPHCIEGTPGARIIPEGMAKWHATIRNDPLFEIPPNIPAAPQILIEKQMLDVFSNPHTGELVERIGPGAEFVVFGVVTEYCVKCAAKGLLERGRKVFVVRDAIETLDATQGRDTLETLRSAGARLVDTDAAVALVEQNPG
jgi:nicotinamidase/pyrazinamidase